MESRYESLSVISMANLRRLNDYRNIYDSTFFRVTPFTCKIIDSSSSTYPGLFLRFSYPKAHSKGLFSTQCVRSSNHFLHEVLIVLSRFPTRIQTLTCTSASPSELPALRNNFGQDTSSSTQPFFYCAFICLMASVPIIFPT